MKSVLAATAWVAGLTMVGRLLGFLRDLLLAASFGPTETADAAVLLLTIPDLLVTLLLAGGFGAALIPALKRLEPAARIGLTRGVLLWTFLPFAGLALILSLAPQIAIALLAPALDSALVADFRAGFVLSSLAIPLVCLAGVLGAYLNAKGVFGTPTLGVIAYNALLCAYLGLLASGGEGVLGLALALLAAVSLRLALHVFAAPELIAPPRHEPAGRAALDRTLLTRFAVGVATSGIIFAAPLVFRGLYANQGDGLLTLFHFAQKIPELPSGILIAPVVLVMLPKLSELAIAEETLGQGEFDRTFATALIAAVSIALSATLAGAVFVRPLAETLFLHGVMTVQDVARIATIALILVLGLPFLAAQQIAAAALNALGRPGAVALTALVALALALAISLAAAPVLPAAVPAPVLGVLVFQVILALANLGLLPAFRRQALRIGLGLAMTAARSTLAILPFLALALTFDAEIGRLSGLALATLAFAGLLLINARDIRPLRKIRSGGA